MCKITGIAVKLKDDTIKSAPIGNTHNVFGDIGELGFINEKGNFLTRKEAFIIAVNNGQLNERGINFYMNWLERSGFPWLDSLHLIINKENFEK
jgi:hypothetical protein